MSYENIIAEVKGNVGLITLNRPQALNALCAALITDIGGALDLFENDENIRAIVITGSERAFAAGADIKEMADYDYMDVYKSDFITKGWTRVASCRKPVIAGRGLCAWRRLRACDDVRHHSCCGYGKVRSAGNHHRNHSGCWRNAAPYACHWQIQSNGNVPYRSDDGC